MTDVEMSGVNRIIYLVVVDRNQASSYRSYNLLFTLKSTIVHRMMIKAGSNFAWQTDSIFCIKLESIGRIVFFFNVSPKCGLSYVVSNSICVECLRNIQYFALLFCLTKPYNERHLFEQDTYLEQYDSCLIILTKAI